MKSQQRLLQKYCEFITNCCEVVPKKCFNAIIDRKVFSSHHDTQNLFDSLIYIALPDGINMNECRDLGLMQKLKSILSSPPILSKAGRLMYF